MKSIEPVADADTNALPPASPPASLRPIAWWPLATIAVVLSMLALLFMTAGTLNLEGFVAIQAVTRGIPDVAWSLVTICGNGLVCFALLSPTLAWRPRWYAAGLAAAALAGLYSNGLKHLFLLPRPASVIDSSRLHVIGETLHANTFPSGHAVTAFTLASLLVLASRSPLSTAAWAVPVALLISISRIAVGAHWPADLAAGAAGGWVCGALAVMIVARWRWWNCESGIRVMGVVSIGIGIALFAVDVGYPLALPLQQLAAVIAIVAGCVAVAMPRVDALLPWRRDDRSDRIGLR